jgi:hypothetical protein
VRTFDTVIVAAREYVPAQMWIVPLGTASTAPWIVL